MRFFPSCFKMRSCPQVEFLQNPYILLQLTELVHVQSPALLLRHWCSDIISLHSPHLISVLLQKSRITEMEEIQAIIQDKALILKKRRFPERSSVRVASVMNSRSSTGAPSLWLWAHCSSHFTAEQGNWHWAYTSVREPHFPLCVFSHHTLAVLSTAG